MRYSSYQQKCTCQCGNDNARAVSAQSARRHTCCLSHTLLHCTTFTYSCVQSAYTVLYQVTKSVSTAYKLWQLNTAVMYYKFIHSKGLKLFKEEYVQYVFGNIITLSQRFNLKLILLQCGLYVQRAVTIWLKY